MGNKHYQLRANDNFQTSLNVFYYKTVDEPIVYTRPHIKKKIIISAGGTGGHIIPALSVAKTILKENSEVIYIGNKKSMEYEIITKNNIPFYSINVQKLYRKFTLKHIMFPFKLLGSILRCIKIFKKEKPDAFLGFGGFVAGPPAIAAWLCRCPVFMQEQNCKPGITNRWTGKLATTIFLAYEESEKYFKKVKTYVTGNPVLYAENAVKSKNKYSTNKKLLILGGSQGSKFINDLILENLEWFKENNIELIWQTGAKHIDEINAATSNYGSPITVFSFSDNLRQFYAQADYTISRGGALTLAEIEIHQIPAFVIPLSTAAVNEQFHNAKNMQKRNMGFMFEEKNKSSFLDMFKLFIEKSKDMYKDCEKSIHIDAAKNIVKLIVAAISDRHP